MAEVPDIVMGGHVIYKDDLDVVNVVYVLIDAHEVDRGTADVSVVVKDVYGHNVVGADDADDLEKEIKNIKSEKQFT